MTNFINQTLLCVIWGYLACTLAHQVIQFTLIYSTETNTALKHENHCTTVLSKKNKIKKWYTILEYKSQLHFTFFRLPLPNQIQLRFRHHGGFGMSRHILRCLSALPLLAGGDDVDLLWVMSHLICNRVTSTARRDFSVWWRNVSVCVRVARAKREGLSCSFSFQRVADSCGVVAAEMNTNKRSAHEHSLLSPCLLFGWMRLGPGCETTNHMDYFFILMTTKYSYCTVCNSRLPQKQVTQTILFLFLHEHLTTQQWNEFGKWTFSILLILVTFLLPTWKSSHCVVLIWKRRGVVMSSPLTHSITNQNPDCIQGDAIFPRRHNDAVIFCLCFTS